MTWLLIGIGAFGLLGISVLCPLASSLVQFSTRKKAPLPASPPARERATPPLIEIAIPAHNEARLLPGTIESILRSIDFLREHPPAGPAPAIRVRVGADGCADETVRVALGYPGVSVVESPLNQGKWATIRSFFMKSTSDWLILVDAGTLWPENFLADALKRIASRPEAIAFAPSYHQLKSGTVHRALWRFEAALKRAEGFCGGPVSVHGATVGYRTSLVRGALARLGDKRWLNDDVVIPLTLRALNPKGVILYPAGEVLDAGAKTDKPDLARRKRILLGNLQWMKSLLNDSFRMNPVAGTLALRRLFRVFWAYWLACIVVGVALAFRAAILPALAGTGILLAASGGFRQLAGAASVSLLAPLLLLRPENKTAGAWK